MFSISKSDHSAWAGVTSSRSVLTLRSWIKGRLTKASDPFDPVFYVKSYPDLAVLDSAKSARAHYLKHGQAEGRYRNAQEKEEADYEHYMIRSAKFDLSAYRELNPDLREKLTGSRAYIIHYIRHGRAEGRRCTFDADSLDPGAQSWEKLLDVSQYAAWISARPQNGFKSRIDAIDHFCRNGIEQLAPLRFDLLFEPEFYRPAYLPGSHADDVTLYRSWLDTGLDSDKAPNEARYLFPYLGNRPFPEQFDWKEYASARMGKAPLPGRWTALAHLFETERDWALTKPFVIAETRLIEAIAEFRLGHGKMAEAAGVLALLADVAVTPKGSILTGQIARRKKKFETARDAFEHALLKQPCMFETLDQAVRANLDCEPARAIALLGKHRETWLGDPRFEQLTQSSLATIYERHCAEAHAALCLENDPDNDFIVAWSTEFEERLRTIAEAIEALEMSPACLGPQADGPVVLLVNEDIRQCTHYRVEQKREQFEVAGIPLRKYAMDDIDGFMTDLIGARAVIFYRVPATLKIMHAMITARGMGIPSYYEIDDLLFCPRSYPDNFASYGEQITRNEYRGLQYSVPLFAAAMALCDRAIASTQALLDCMIPLVRDHRGILLTNGFDSRNSHFLGLDHTKASQPDGKLRIFYGSNTLAHTGDFSELCVPALLRVLIQYPQVELVLVGHVADDPRLIPYSSRIRRFPIIVSLDEYWSLLSACDVNLAVLRPGLGNDCKSEIKWLEAAMFSIPTVASASATMRTTVRDGVDGLLANDGETWYICLASLIQDSVRRHDIGRAARLKAITRYSLLSLAKRVQAEFGFIQAAAKPAEELRLLVVNVFFAPNSIGGATRVVENNVQHIMRNCPDITIGVVCTDVGQETPYQLRTSQYGGTPVFRISAPSATTEMRAFDEGMAAPFRSVLARFKPDLVHFHCIQRLTATVVQECWAAEIPYLVTLHDAWWFSPWQFLVDRDGFVKMPTRDLLAEHTPGRGEQALARHQLLRAQLLRAERILTVSDAFARVCDKAQLARVTVIANGLPDLAPLVPALPSSDALRLGHIGGRVSHKGADLIEAALRRGNYPRLALLMIDGTLPTGESRETVWGSSRVTLAAPWPQGEVAQLYGCIDVLLAPSTWPESYGLVAREAEYYGLWVVASACGAMGEDIIEDKNGFRIDTGDRQALDDVLHRMNANPERFRQGTATPAGEQRHARAQADELADLYRAIAGKCTVPSEPSLAYANGANLRLSGSLVSASQA